MHLTGRAAELIKRGGLMIHAQEVEYALSLYDSVVEATVVGVPAKAHDEEVVAFASLSVAALDLAASATAAVFAGSTTGRIALCSKDPDRPTPSPRRSSTRRSARRKRNRE